MTLPTPDCDLFIIGGGINGTGIARDAAGRGLKVILVEQNDLASATSSASSKLIHGGLRYLEHYEFRLVRESLQERETLWQLAPHLIRPLRFVLPHHKGLRPAFILRLGLFLYDHIGGRKMLPPTETLKLREVTEGEPLRQRYEKGFEYSDCWVDDARLVIANALGAKERGATILNGHRFIRAVREDQDWRIMVEDPAGKQREYTATAVVNAAGPWVEPVLHNCVITSELESRARLVKGSHIVVPKLYDGDQCYTFQNHDRRVIFAIPYEQEYTLIGTTDVPFYGEPASVHASDAEVSYLCAAASAYFEKPVEPDDLVASYAGIRPLYDDGAQNASATTRDYHLDLDVREDALPLLSIFGGKVTTYRRLAEEAMEKLSPFFSYLCDDWTGYIPLPGGIMPEAETPADAFALLLQEMRDLYPWLDADIMHRMTRAYGSTVRTILDGSISIKDLGDHFGAGLYEVEVRHLIEHEWARSADDILWRRSKLGLHMSKDDRNRLELWIDLNYTDIALIP